MEFQAIYERRPGRIRLSRDILQFQSDEAGEAPIQIPLSDVRVSHGGENRTVVLLKSRTNPHFLISTTELEILNFLEVAGLLEATLTQGRVRKRINRRWISLGIVFGVIVLFLLVLPAASLIAPKSWIEFFVSRERERQIVKAVSFGEGVSESSNQNKLEQQIQSLVKFLQDKNPSLQKLPIETVVKADETVNAFAYPGDVLVVHRGLLRQAESIDEVLGVIAHEMGHISERHVLKAMGDQLSFMVAGLMLSTVIGNEATTALFSGGNLVSLKFSRENEKEADERALEYLDRAQISAQGFQDFMERLPSLSLGAGSERALALLSTHPASAERVEMMSKHIAKHSVVLNGRPPVSIEELKAALGPDEAF